MKKQAAIILCAGKGTRMNDRAKNKVCFDCAGVPVIKRIIENMRLAGVNLFVIVIGHRATDVMKCLDGTEGVLYAYQRRQLGTGHAALTGLRILSGIGYAGDVIISMGDMIVAPDVVREMIAMSKCHQAVCVAQPVSLNPSGGRMIIRNEKLYGIVEFADAAYMAVWNLPGEKRQKELCALGMSPEKAKRLVERNENRLTKSQCAFETEIFTAREILGMEYVNTALYIFPVREIIKALSGVKRENAQNEIYLTDGIEYLAKKNKARVLKVDDANKMLTYSTKSELNKIHEILRCQ